MTEPSPRRPRVLVGYATAAGSTRGIAERIATGLRAAGHEVVLQPLSPDLDTSGFDAFVLGSAVHQQRWLPAAVHFLRAARPTLGAAPVWCFSVGGVNPDGPVRRALLDAEVARIARSFPSGVVPREHRAFGGVVVLAGLPLWAKAFWLLVGGRPGDHRDWPAIDRWAAAIAARVTAGEAAPGNHPAASGAGPG